MKKAFKIYFFFLSIISANNLKAQVLDTYTKEVVKIFKSISRKELKIPIYLKSNTLMLPSSLSSYQEYNSELVARKISDKFTPSKSFNLTKQDCMELNNKMADDLSEMNLKSNWFSDAKIHSLNDSIINKQLISGFKFVKPLFFRHYTRCFMVNFDSTSLDAYFIKKVNGHWVFDRFYLRYEAED
jgi:hypothetical protein